MRVLVTGAAGFVGRHAVRDLADHGHVPLALDQAIPAPLFPGVESREADLLDDAAIGAVFAELKPEACLHLGAIAFVPEGRVAPGNVLAVNILGTVHVLEALRRHAPACRFLFVSTAQVYAPSAGGPPLTEEAPLRPTTLYAISKAAADQATLGYARRHRLAAMTVRPNNHTGPGQAPRFAVPSFVRQIRAIARGQAPAALRVGNLDSRRDIADVRDIVAAYRLLIERGRPGEAYNLSAQNLVRMRDVVERLCALTNIRPSLEVDPALVRPADDSPIVDTQKLRRDTGWTPRVPFAQTLEDMLNDPAP